MRLAISNIAWDPVEDEAIARLLERYAIDAIDIAPGKYFPDPTQATDRHITEVKGWWADKGIEITGMQSLLFGTTGLNIFAADDVQNTMLEHLRAVCRIAGGLGSVRLVFGSPKNRDRTGLSDQQALDIAVQFFQRLGDIAQINGVMICLEPNPTSYGANFMTTSADTLAVVQAVSHPNIRMQLDTGALTLNQEDPAEVILRSASSIGHVHASEPNLISLGDGDCRHAEIASLLRRHLPRHLVSIEMVATQSEPHVVSIERALRAAITAYRSEAHG